MRLVQGLSRYVATQSLIQTDSWDVLQRISPPSDMKARDRSLSYQGCITKWILRYFQSHRSFHACFSAQVRHVDGYIFRSCSGSGLCQHLRLLPQSVLQLSPIVSTCTMQPVSLTGIGTRINWLWEICRSEHSINGADLTISSTGTHFNLPWDQDNLPQEKGMIATSYPWIPC